jgi:uncharacterized damage-inducible protein DinB
MEERMESEIQSYIAEFRSLRGEIQKSIQGLSDEAANWRPLPKDTNSIYALITHLAGAQSNWIKRVIAGIPVQRDREAEFKSAGSLSEAVKNWEAVDREAEEILLKLSPEQLGETRDVSGPFGRVTVRWCILHQIRHYAMHLGHIQLTQQLWNEHHG